MQILTENRDRANSGHLDMCYLLVKDNVEPATLFSVKCKMSVLNISGHRAAVKVTLFQTP